MDKPMKEITINIDPKELPDPIVTTHPTFLDIERAEEEYKLVLAFVQYPQDMLGLLRGGEVVAHVAIEAFALGLMQGWGLPPSLYLMIIIVGEGLTIEEASREYLAELRRKREQTSNRLAGFSSSRLPSLGSAGISNFIEKKTIEMWKRNAVKPCDS